MNLDNQVLSLMQNVADKLDGIDKKKNSKNEGSETNDIAEIRKGIEEHNKNMTMSITKMISIMNNTPSDASLELKLQESITRIKTLSETLEAYINNPEAKVTYNRKELVVFGKDSSFTTKHFLIILGIVILTISSLKYLPTFFDYYSEIKSERDTYKTFYQYHYLRFTKGNNNKAIDNMENQLKLIQQQDSSFMYDYNTMEKWLKKDVQIKQLKNQLKEVEQ